MKTGSVFSLEQTNPLKNIDQWDDDVLKRYPEAGEPAKAKDAFRNYEEPGRDTVREFYRLNHTYQTYNFVSEKEKEFLQFNRKEMPVWSAMEFLNTLVDDSDPDTDLDQLQHLLQTAEAIRADGHPDSECPGLSCLRTQAGNRAAEVRKSAARGAAANLRH